jgi:hypothetical protein
MPRKPLSERTHCIHGHELAIVGIYHFEKHGKRSSVCKRCALIAQTNKRRRRKGVPEIDLVPKARWSFNDWSLVRKARGYR